MIVRDLKWKILLNYLILVVCTAGFRGGAMTALVLPVLQIILSYFHYKGSNKWQTVLMLEIHLFVSTVTGLFLLGYLYLKYISEDVESVIIFTEIFRIGAALVLGMGIAATLFKYLSIKKKV